MKETHPQNSPLRKSITRVSGAEEKLAETLSAEQRKMLGTLMDAQVALTADLERDAFITGLHLGARMMMEILDAEDCQNVWRYKQNEGNQRKRFLQSCSS